MSNILHGVDGNQCKNDRYGSKKVKKDETKTNFCVKQGRNEGNSICGCGEAAERVETRIKSKIWKEGGTKLEEEVEEDPESEEEVEEEISRWSRRKWLENKIMIH